MSAEKERIGLTLTKPYLDGIDRMVEAGVYVERQEAIREALRRFLKDWCIPPFYLEEAE